MENNGFNKQYPVQGFFQKPQTKPTPVADQNPTVNSTVNPTPLVTPKPVASPAPIVNSVPVVEPAQVVNRTPGFNPTPVVTPTPVTSPTPNVNSVPVVNPVKVVNQAPSSNPAPIVTPATSVTPAPVVNATPVVDQVEQIQKLTEGLDAPVVEDTNTPTTAVSQLQLTAFFTCTERYENILQVFPNEFRCGTDAFNQDVHIAKVKGVKPTELAVIRLFNLFSEEFYLEGIGALPPAIWNIWKEQMISLIRTKLLREAWQKLKDDFTSQAEFQQFVEHAIDSE